MKKNLYLYILITAFQLLLFSHQARASHAAAAEINYTCLPGNQIKVTVNLFSDCAATGQQVYTTLDIQYNSTSCSQSGAYTIPLLSGGGVEVATGDYPDCGPTSCNGGSAYGIRKYVYEGTFTLPQACSDWILSCELINRNNIITTINSANLYSIYLEAVVDNLNYPNNASPFFNNSPVALTCLNQLVSYDGQATDPDLDSLVYTLIAPRGSLGPGNPVVALSYTGTYSPTNPLSTVSGTTIGNPGGVLSFSPDQLQVAVIVIRIDEYRNGILIGSVMRDMQINVQALCNIIPSMQQAIMTAVNCKDSILDLHLDKVIQCSSLSADGSEFRLLGPNNTPLPVIAATAVGCVGNFTDHIQISLNSPLVQNGNYALWTKNGNDLNVLLNRCGNDMLENDTLFFSLNNCFSGTMDLLNVSVNNINTAIEITWQIPPGLSVADFVNYKLYRSDLPNGPYTLLTTLNNLTDTFYTDVSAAVETQPYNYSVSATLNTGYVTPRSDSIQSIFLQCVENADSLTMDLNWTNYRGWNNPVYEVEQIDSFGNSAVIIGSATTSLSSHYVKPTKNGLYHVRVRTSNQGNPELISRSNWCEFRVLNTEVVVPNVFTPNDDKRNDIFVVQNLEQYPNSSLIIYDRWGKEVYKNNNYLNDWKGNNLEDGTYYYVLKVNDANKTQFHGTLSIFRK
ncbi:MAG: gliding motility-associated C-terminal domain-containing protein [Bacteroidia bacterium]